MNFPKHCNNGGDLSIPLVAYVHMIDYTDDIDPLPTEDIPLFVTNRFQQELQRKFYIPEFANAFKEPTDSIRGRALSSDVKGL